MSQVSSLPAPSSLPSCAPVSDYARGQARPSITQTSPSATINVYSVFDVLNISMPAGSSTACISSLLPSSPRKLGRAMKSPGLSSLPSCTPIWSSKLLCSHHPCTPWPWSSGLCFLFSWRLSTPQTHPWASSQKPQPLIIIIVHPSLLPPSPWPLLWSRFGP